MVRHVGSSAGSYLADPAWPIPSHCASIVVTSTLRVKWCVQMKDMLSQEKHLQRRAFVPSNSRKPDIISPCPGARQTWAFLLDAWNINAHRHRNTHDCLLPTLSLRTLVIIFCSLLCALQYSIKKARSRGFQVGWYYDNPKQEAIRTWARINNKLATHTHACAYIVTRLAAPLQTIPSNAVM